MGVHSQLSHYKHIFLYKKTIMNNQVKVFALALCFCSSLVSASSVLDNEEAQKEARTVFTSGGTYYLALNTTYLIYYGIIIGLGLLAAFALASVGTSSASSGDGNQYSRNSYVPPVSEEEYLHQRQQRSTEDIASKMAQLEQAFKKYQVTEAECEM